MIDDTHNSQGPGTSGPGTSGSGTPGDTETPEVIEPVRDAMGGGRRADKTKPEPHIIEGEAREVNEDVPDGEGSDGNGGGGLMPWSLRVWTIASLALGAAALLIALYAGYRVTLGPGGSGVGPGVSGARVGGQSGDPFQASAADVQALGARLDALEKSSRLSVDDAAERFGAMTGLVADLENRLAGLEDADRGAVAVPGRLAALDARLSALGETAVRLGGEIEALQRSQPPADLAARVQRLDNSVQALQTAITALGTTLTQNSQRLAALEVRAKEPSAAAKAALGLAVGNLMRALEAGTPFSQELEAVSAFAPDDPGIVTLQKVADEGVVSRADLRTQFEGLIDGILTAERQAGRDGFWAKLIGNAMSLVTVRRTGEVAGDTTDAIVARIEHLLEAGDFAAALQEGEALQGPAADVARPWLDRLRARLEAEWLIRDLSARALSGFAAEARSPEAAVDGAASPDAAGGASRPGAD